MSSFFSSLFGSKPKMSLPSFEGWAASTTQDDVHELFLQVLKEGDADDGIGESISAEELAHFNTTISSITGTSSTSPESTIPVSEIIAHLANSHREIAPLITSASDPLTILLSTHASFPFPTSPTLTSSSLLRAIALLTSNSDKLFGTAGWIGDAVTIRERTPKQCIAFIFASLASASPRSDSVDDVLDVLCRLPYPRVKAKSGDLRRRDVNDLVPIARRLLQQHEAEQLQNQHIKIAQLRSLANLVGELNGRKGDIGLKGKDKLDGKEFEEWATKVNLLSALDELFACFLREGE